MKVAVVSNGAHSLLNFRGPLMAEMIERGHEVIALAPDHNSETKRALRSIGVEPKDFRLARSMKGLIGEAKSIVELRNLLKEERPDVIFAYFLKPVIYGTLAAWLAKIPRRYGLIAGLGFAFSDADAGKSKLKRAFRCAITFCARFTFRKIDRLMFQNIDDLNEFVTRKYVAPDKTALVGATGVDMSKWRVAPFPDGPLTFILVARLLREKGIKEYAEAARLIKAKSSNIRFLLLGGVDDNVSALSSHEIRAWVDEGLIEWPGKVPVQEWIARSHVFVLPSYYREGIPRSTQEAMAMGRPVITTGLPGCRETIEDGVNGFVIPPKDSAGLSKAMERFMIEPSLVDQMGRHSRRMAEERFDVHKLNRDSLKWMDL